MCVCSNGTQRIVVERAALETERRVVLLGKGKLDFSPLVDAAAAMPLVGCGQPLANASAHVELLIVDDESGRRVGDDRVGEIWVRSPSKAHGYWGRARQSLADFGALPADGDGAGGIRTVESSDLAAGPRDAAAPHARRRPARRP